MAQTTARIKKEGKNFEVLVDLDEALKFKKGELKNYFNGDYIKFRIIIVHTFGVITREGKTSFKTGYFTLK